jgi:intracellular sulfur oxidation DsrE/DsrF family protein
VSPCDLTLGDCGTLKAETNMSSLARRFRYLKCGHFSRKEVHVKSESTIQRRSFLGGMFGAAAAAGLAMTGTRAEAAYESGTDDWIKGVKGTHRCLFDFPQHKNGMPLLHILNYLNTYTVAYKTEAGQVGAVGTFYSAGSQASIPLAFNDVVWQKYGLGVYTGLKDADGQPYTRNVFNRPTSRDLHLLMQAIDSPMIPALADAMPGLGIESLQKMGTTFVLCANALGIWCLELEARGKGKAQDIDKELRANLLPGVTIVPAMVIAIEKAQEAGIKYNRQ